MVRVNFHNFQNVGLKEPYFLIHLCNVLISVSMSCSKHGSRSIDAIRINASQKLRELLASKLCQHESRLNSDQYGRFVSLHLNLNLYKRSPEEWKGSFDKAEKTKKLFSDFLQTKPAKPKESKGFVLDTQGDSTLLKSEKIETKEEPVEPPPKKKKKKAASYLDDL